MLASPPHPPGENQDHRSSSLCHVAKIGTQVFSAQQGTMGAPSLAAGASPGQKQGAPLVEVLSVPAGRALAT